MDIWRICGETADQILIIRTPLVQACITDWKQRFKLLYPACENPGPQNKLLQFNKSLLVLSEILDMWTLKQTNKNWLYFRETPNIVNFINT